MFQKIVNIIIFIDRCARNIFLPESQNVFSTQVHSGKPLLSPIVNIFFFLLKDACSYYIILL